MCASVREKAKVCVCARKIVGLTLTRDSLTSSSSSSMQRINRPHKRSVAANTWCACMCKYAQTQANTHMCTARVSSGTHDRRQKASMYAYAARIQGLSAFLRARRPLCLQILLGGVVLPIFPKPGAARYWAARYTLAGACIGMLLAGMATLCV